MTFCLYSLQHSPSFLDAVKASKDEEFDYDVNDASIWKHEDGKCGNPECKFIHDRKAFIESIHNDPKYYILSIMLMSINKPQSNISVKLYNPIKKEKFNSENTKTDFTNHLHGKELYDNVDDVRNYAKYNGWYLFHNISRIVNDIMMERIAWQKSNGLIKCFWKMYMATYKYCHINVCDKPTDYCIRYISDPTRCKFKDKCQDSHDMERMKNDMLEDIRVWTKITGRMICFAVHKNIHKMNYCIPYKSEQMITDCNIFIRKYKALYIRSYNNPILFRSIIEMIFKFEDDHKDISKFECVKATDDSSQEVKHKLISEYTPEKKGAEN